MGSWLKENAVVLIIAFLVFCLASFWIDRSYEYGLKKLDVDQAVKMNKAEEGVKLKFGITKEQ
jgi:uncharacterized membrane protein YwzB